MKLKRINEIPNDINEISRNIYITDNTLNVTGILSGEKFPLDYLKSRQVFLLSEFYKKIRKEEDAVLCLQGDSTFYGHDTTSADRRPPLDGHVQTRASVTPSEALQEYCDEIFGSSKINVLNRGYSGDGARDGYNRWATQSGADLTIMNYGINDATATWIDYKGNISEFIKWYEKLICREIIRGSAVVLLTPYKQGSATYIDISVFSNAIKVLARKYSIPIIIGDELLQNMSISVYSDNIHLNGKGYRKIGARLSSILIGEGLINVKQVGNGDKLLTRSTCDNVLYKNSTFTYSEGCDTPSEININGGICLNIGYGSVVYYGFYAKENDLLVVPNLYLNNADCKITLDFETESPCFSCSSLVGNENSFTTVKPRESVTILENSQATYSRKNDNVDDKYIHIATKGWHMLKIEITRVSLTNGVLRGIEFINFDNYQNFKVSTSKTLKNGYLIRTHSSYTESANVTKTDVYLPTLLSSLGGLPEITDEYWRGYPLKVKINNFDQSVLEYVIVIGNMYQNNGFYLCSNYNRYNISNSPASERLLTGISYNITTKTLTLNWGGETTRPTSILITV